MRAARGTHGGRPLVGFAQPLPSSKTRPARWRRKLLIWKRLSSAMSARLPGSVAAPNPIYVGSLIRNLLRKTSTYTDRRPASD